MTHPWRTLWFKDSTTKWNRQKYSTNTKNLILLPRIQLPELRCRLNACLKLKSLNLLSLAYQKASGSDTPKATWVSFHPPILHWPGWEKEQKKKTKVVILHVIPRSIYVTGADPRKQTWPTKNIYESCNDSFYLLLFLYSERAKYNYLFVQGEGWGLPLEFNRSWILNSQFIPAQFADTRKCRV